MKNKLHVPVVVETDENGVFIVSCPTFKGCHSYGKTINEALANLQEVVELCVEEVNLQMLQIRWKIDLFFG
jgi:predicted RNase H-like HicB family nuclease